MLADNVINASTQLVVEDFANLSVKFDKNVIEFNACMIDTQKSTKLATHYLKQLDKIMNESIFDEDCSKEVYQMVDLTLNITATIPIIHHTSKKTQK